MRLIEQLRKSRMRQVTAGGMDFTVRRPTDLEVAKMRGEAISPFDIVLRHTVGWSATEQDVVGNGSSAVVPFDGDLFAEWVVDRPELWEPLAVAVMDAYGEHRRAMEGSAKN